MLTERGRVRAGSGLDSCFEQARADHEANIQAFVHHVLRQCSFFYIRVKGRCVAPRASILAEIQWPTRLNLVTMEGAA